MYRLSIESDDVFNEDNLNLLRKRNITTVLQLIRCESEHIVRFTSISLKDIRALKKRLLRKYGVPPIGGYESYKNFIKNSTIIPSGIESIDELLNGGLYTGKVYEICGLPACGKTLFCLNLIKNVSHNLQQNVFYLDTKHSFSARKMKELLKNADKEELVNTFNRILIKDINCQLDLLNSLQEIEKKLREGFKLRLIIIDSLLPVVLPSFDYIKSNMFINQLSNIMNYLMGKYYVVFLVTNLLRKWNEGDFKNRKKNVETIACGKYWYTIPNVRLKMEKLPNNFKISLFNSNSILNNSTSQTEITFTL